MATGPLGGQLDAPGVVARRPAEMGHDRVLETDAHMAAGQNRTLREGNLARATVGLVLVLEAVPAMRANRAPQTRGGSAVLGKPLMFIVFW